MNYVLMGSRTVQVSEDNWERQVMTKIIDETTTVFLIFEWAEKNSIDINSIKLLPNTK